MSLSRRFLSLIVNNEIPGGKSLRRIDLTRHKLFNTLPGLPLNGNTSESSEGNATLSPGGGKPKMKTIRLPSPSFNFQCSATGHLWYMNCFPLAADRILCSDQSGRCALFNPDMLQVEHMPYHNMPKSLPFSIFVPNDDDDSDDGRGSIYIMASRPSPESGDATQLSYQFEAFVYRRPTATTSFTKSWQCEQLPPPPFLHNPRYYEQVQHSTRPRISSYAVVGGGSQVCISVENAGTYCLDTVTHTWTKVGEWTLPFVGKVEYVPELKLWFGICESEKDLQLGAADLSTMGMDSQPQLVNIGKEFVAPEEWTALRHPQFVNLGSGRFCIARFFCALNPMDFFDPDVPEEDYFTVLTGMDVVPACVHNGNGTSSAACSNVNDNNGKVELKMVKHNSKRHVSYGSDGTIGLVF